MSKPTNIKEYIAEIPEERKAAFNKLRAIFKKELGGEFEETFHYSMLGYVVSHADYPDGYHCDPTQPLPFVNLGNQKKYIAIYHMGMYADDEIKDWFVEEYGKQCKTKLDMGKSCIRLKKMDDIPFELISKLLQKQSRSEWITLYEKKIKK